MLDNEKYMQRCFQLALNGLGNVAPNPLVGCVIVNKGEIIGEGYHQKYGEAHAEVNAINSVKDKSLLANSTVYVNLEPCAHFGKTPPCADLLVKHNVKEVVISNSDPNPKVAGKGVEILKAAGIKVITGILENEGWDINKRFFTNIVKSRPYIILKWAQSIDGYIDKHRKENEKGQFAISNELSKMLVHKWRSEETSIMVGSNTALNDNPQLNVRLWKGKDPIRIVIDRDLKLPSHLHLFDNSIPTIVFTEKAANIQNATEFIKIDFADLPQEVMSHLHQKNISSVIIEGGAKLLNSFISSGLWDEARVFTATKKSIHQGVSAPVLNCREIYSENLDDDILKIYRNQ
jgi:diaminohydroxyphosphoribosylaminopyrimidine deaminase / 5-amino-6-(5-phosphoribosylamino)uracil reductase